MIRLTPNLRSIVDHDGAVILDVANDTVITLDSIGAYVWQRLQRGLQLFEIATELARDTGADQNVVMKDIGEFMEQLKSRHLVFTGDDNTRIGI